MKIKLLSTSLLFVASIFTTNVHAILPKDTPVEGSSVAFAYKLDSSKEVYGKDFDTYYHPASTQKLLTALSAILYLGNDFELKTKLLVEQKAISNNALVIDQNGILHSDVIVKFTGDPTLTTQKYREMFAFLVKAGVKGIDGRVILDTSRFAGKSRGNGWSWDDLPVCFTAPSASIVLNRNCTYAQLSSNGVGSKATPIIPSGVPIRITSDVVAVKNSDYGGDCELEANLFIDNNYHLTGCLPENNNKPYPISLAIADPIRWGMDWTLKILDDLNLQVTGGIVSDITQRSDTIAVYQIKSAPMSKLVKYMLQKSNNLYADTIAKNVAAEYYNLPATYYRANKAIRSILRQYANIDLGNAYIVDGSGLSPHNLLSPRNLLEILIYIKKHDSTLNFIDLLPVSGVSGTLNYRASTINEPLKTNVIAKTGSLQNVYNLAGFVRSAHGNLIPFVIFANSVSYDERTRDKVKYRHMPSPHYAYERYLLEKIYNEEKIIDKK